MVFKTVPSGDPGDSTRFGGNDLNKVMSQLNGTDNDAVKLPVDYIDLNMIAEPSSPSSGYIRVFMDSTTGKVHAKHSDGSVTVLE